jgi:lysophospholipase L1-like esterase
MSQDIRICFVGDSFVNGTCDATHVGWTGRLCANLTQYGLMVTYYNLGVRRETSADIAQRWETETDRRLPKGCDNRVVFSFGTNDTTIENGRCRLELTDSLRYTQQILSTAQSQYPILMIGPPAISDPEQNRHTQELSQAFSTVCAQLNVPYLDLLTPLSQSSVWMESVQAGDGAHPDSRGYEAIAHLIQSWSGWWYPSPGG